jgi:hypothetical protein
MFLAPGFSHHIHFLDNENPRVMTWQETFRQERAFFLTGKGLQKSFSAGSPYVL